MLRKATQEPSPATFSVGFAPDSFRTSTSPGRRTWEILFVY